MVWTEAHRWRRCGCWPRYGSPTPGCNVRTVVLRDRVEAARLANAAAPTSLSTCGKSYIPLMWSAAERTLAVHTVASVFGDHSQLKTILTSNSDI